MKTSSTDTRKPCTPSRARQRARPVEPVRRAAARLLQLADLSVVDVTLATLVANQLDGDPLWLVVVSPPSNGKTELLVAAAQAPKTSLLSTLTKNTLVSGQRPVEPDDPVEPSLLPDLTGKTLVLKDFTTILGLQRDERNAILNLLREVYDGKVAKSFGTGKRFTWTGKMGLLVGVTPFFDHHSAVQTILGERFLLYRIPAGDRDLRRAQARMALHAAGREKMLREQLGKAVLRSYRGTLRWRRAIHGSAAIPAEFEETLVSLADLAAHGRAGVMRDGYNREVKYLPEPEGPGRLVKQLRQLLLALTLVHGKRQPDAEELTVLRKVARDTMHPFKARVVAALAREDMDTAALVRATGLTYAMVQREMEDCALLGLADRDTTAKVWRLSPERREDIHTSGIFTG